MANLTELRPALALLLIGTLAGFLFGRATAPSTTPSDPSIAARKLASDGPDDQAASSSGSDTDASPTELSTFPGNREECKLVLAVRTDLGMTKGKMAAQCSHATLACYKALAARDSVLLERWERLGQAKVTVQVKSEEDLLELQARAMSLGLCARLIHDAGRTQIASGSATVLGVGPGPRSVVDSVTGGLKLL